MPHLVILHTGNLGPEADMSALCRQLANALCAQRDEAGEPVFPTGGVRVLAFAATHYAVADGGAAGRDAGGSGGSGDYSFIWLNLRMGRGRSPAVQRQVGSALEAVARAHFAPLLATRHIGVTLQIDEGAEVFNARLGNLHPLFAVPAPGQQD